MDRMKYFFECYYHMNQGPDDLDRTIEDFKNSEPQEKRLAFTSELKLIIENKLYEKAAFLIKKYGTRRLSFKKTELLLNYIYNKLCNIPSDIKITDLK